MKQTTSVSWLRQLPRRSMAPEESQEAEARAMLTWTKEWERKKIQHAQVARSGEENSEKFQIFQGLYQEIPRTWLSFKISGCGSKCDPYRQTTCALAMHSKLVDVSTWTGNVAFQALWKFYCSQPVFFFAIAIMDVWRALPQEAPSDG